MNQNFSEATRFLAPASFWSPEWLPPQSAWYEHGPFAFWLMDALRPASFVELGSHWGFSYLAFCQAAKALQLPIRCHAVDTWQGDEHAGYYAQAVFEAVQTHNQQHYAAFSNLIRATFDEAAAAFPDGSIDLLHIDGLHTYEAVKHDFATWRPKLSPRGVVLFHDIQVHERNFGVWRLWQELSSQHPHFEFLHEHGLGVLGVGRELPPALSALFAAQANAELANLIRTLYVRLGVTISTQAQLQAAKKLLARPLRQLIRERLRF